MAIFNNGITVARKRAGLTQQQLADAINVSLRTVSRWEKIPIEKMADAKIPLGAIARALGVTTDELMSPTSEDKKTAPASTQASEGSFSNISTVIGNGNSITQNFTANNPHIHIVTNSENEVDIVNRLIEEIKRRAGTNSDIDLLDPGLLDPDLIDALCRRKHFTKEKLIARLKIIGLKSLQGIALGFVPFLSPQGVQDVINATEQYALKLYPIAEMSEEEKAYVNQKWRRKSTFAADLEAAHRLRHNHPEIIKLLADKDFTEAQIRALASAPREESKQE